MAKAFQPTIDLTWDLPVGVIKAVHDVVNCAAFGRDMQIFHGHQFCNGETVMYLNQTDLVARLLNTCFLVGALCCSTGRYKMAAIPGIVL